MHYLLFYDVVPDNVERRAVYRAEHLRLARAAADRGELLAAGALTAPINTPVLLFQGDWLAAAEAFALAQPCEKRPRHALARAHVDDGGRADRGAACRVAQRQLRRR